MARHPNLAALSEHDLRANAFASRGKPVATFPDHAESNFSRRQRVSPPWTRGTEVLSTPCFRALRPPTAAFVQATDRHQPPHFSRIFIMTQVDHTRMANAIRGLAMDAVEKAKSGHPGLPM